MVLKTATAAAPKFEDADDEAFANVAVDTADAPAPAPAAAPVTLAVAPAAKPSAIAKAKPINMADFDVLAVLENRLPPVGFGEGVRLVGSNGNVMDNDKKLLGDEITLLLLSWNKRWVISTGADQDDKEAKKAARYSTDGVTTNQGEDCKEYLQQLKDDGYEKASMKEYIDLFGLLQDSKKESAHCGKSVTVALSPDSCKAFMGLRRDLVVMGITGKLPEGLSADTGVSLKLSAEVKSTPSLSWTRLACSLAS